MGQVGQIQFVTAELELQEQKPPGAVLARPQAFPSDCGHLSPHPGRLALAARQWHEDSHNTRS